MTTATRRKGRSVRLYEDQLEAAARYAAAQTPPGRPEDVLRWWVDLGLAVAEAAAATTRRKK